MENASKALLMAAGVLIGMLILSLTVYLFVSFGGTSAQAHKEKEAQELEQFNSQFTSYVGKDGITIYDVVTVANLATENNKYYEYAPRRAFNEEWTDNYIAVQLQGRGSIEKIYGDHSNYDHLIRQYLETQNMDEQPDDSGGQYLSLKQFNCEVFINETTGRVYKVNFTEIP